MRDEEQREPLKERTGENETLREAGAQPLSAKGSRVGQELFDWAQVTVQVLVSIVLLFTFVLRNTGVIGHSMNPTLYDGEWVIMSNLLYEPKQGDIVVLHKKSFMDEAIVKRVIATEGQVLVIDYLTNSVYVDGILYDIPPIPERMNPAGDIQTLTVPEGCIFVMGDNRNHSTDSRFHVLGAVDKRYVLGHVIFRVYPFNRIGPVK